MRATETPEGGPAISVSVVIPTRGRPELVLKAVASALAQTFERIEVIVVADGEDPRTRRALDGVRDPRLRVVDLAVSVGGAEARNIGVRAARGEWIAFLDDDDEWLPHKLSRQIVAARRSRALLPVISSRVIVRTAVGEFIRPLRPYDPKKPVSEFLFCRRSLDDGPYAMQTSTLMMRREFMCALPFRAELKRHQDWDWLLRAERVPGVEFAVIDEPLAIYRTEDGRESVGQSQDWKYSMQWGREMQGFFSPKAYSWFLASECAPRAVKSRAGLRIFAEIARQFLLDGRPSWGSAAMLAAFLALPQQSREALRRFKRRTPRREGGPLPSLTAKDVQATAGMELRSAGQ
jgi:glycosyltransferase involved in cell wall biosynthesis